MNFESEIIKSLLKRIEVLEEKVSKLENEPDNFFESLDKLIENKPLSKRK